MSNSTSTKIDFSATESETLGLKTCRCNNDYFDETELYRLLVDGNYDICRVKVTAEDEYAAARLHKSGIPAFFSGSIRRYKTKISAPPDGTYNYPDLVWEFYDGTQKQLLKDMLVGTWGTYPIGYYRSPYLCELVNKEREIESVFRFYEKQNNPAINPENTFVFIKHGENYVGFFALNKVNGNLESHVGGILEPYRKGGYFLDKLRFIKQYCLDNGLPYFIFGARNENAAVQRIFQHVGFQPIGCENVFHMASLLSFGREHSEEITVNADNDVNKMRLLVLAECQRIADKFLPKADHISFRLNHHHPIINNQVKLRFSLPVVTTCNILIVVQCESSPGAYFTAYYAAERPDQST